MSIEQQELDQIYQVIKTLVSDGKAEFRPGHVAQALRASGEPMGTWQIRATMSALEAAGLISHDADRNLWSLSSDAEQVASG
ncbi:MAG: hypothetical protein ACR2PZ_13420 [Pseudomonadales bacterium]